MRKSGSASPACRWGTNSLRWCWPCCGPAATRPRSMPICSSRSAASKAISISRCISRFLCHNCPDVVQALTLMAFENSRITATLIEGGTFQDEVERRDIMAVPATFSERRTVLQRQDGTGRNPRQGRHRAPMPRRPRSLPRRTRSKSLVVGGGPAGAGAAIYTARKGFPHRHRGRTLRRAATRYAGNREPARHGLHRRTRSWPVSLSGMSANTISI